MSCTRFYEPGSFWAQKLSKKLLNLSTARKEEFFDFLGRIPSGFFLKESNLQEVFQDDEELHSASISAGKALVQHRLQVSLGPQARVHMQAHGQQVLQPGGAGAD